jgi:hypothetical protein
MIKLPKLTLLFFLMRPALRSFGEGGSFVCPAGPVNQKTKKMQNKPNSCRGVALAKTDLSPSSARRYKNFTRHSVSEGGPIQTQSNPKTKPFLPPKTALKAKTNPIQTQTNPTCPCAGSGSSRRSKIGYFSNPTCPCMSQAGVSPTRRSGIGIRFVFGLEEVLEDLCGGDGVEATALLFLRQIGLPKLFLSAKGTKTFILEVDGHIELPFKLFGKLSYAFCLKALGTVHVYWQADYNSVSIFGFHDLGDFVRQVLAGR